MQGVSFTLARQAAEACVLFCRLSWSTIVKARQSETKTERLHLKSCAWGYLSSFGKSPWQRLKLFFLLSLQPHPSPNSKIGTPISWAQARRNSITRYSSNPPTWPPGVIYHLCTHWYGDIGVWVVHLVTIMVCGLQVDDGDQSSSYNSSSMLLSVT